MVILLSEMGSLVLAYPMFKAIKRKYPGVKLACLVFEKNREVLDILDVTDAESVLTIRDTNFFSFLKDSLEALRRMRRLNLDIVIDCELFARFSSIFSFLSGAEIRVGFHAHTQEGLYRGDFINRKVLYNPYKHLSRQFLTLLQSIDSNEQPVSKFPVDRKKLTPPKVVLEPEEIAAMKTRFHEHFPIAKNKLLVLIYPGGGILPIRAWPLEHFCWVSRELIKAGFVVVVIGQEEDKELARTIQSACGDPAVVDLTGYTKTIRELLQMYHAASLLITNDGGPGQFASMTGLPAIILYGPETPVLYGPLTSNGHVFFESLSCSPCLTAYNHRDSPCDGNNLCLKRIQPESVLRKALEILSEEKSSRLPDR